MKFPCTCLDTGIRTCLSNSVFLEKVSFKKSQLNISVFNAFIFYCKIKDVTNLYTLITTCIMTLGC